MDKMYSVNDIANLFGVSHQTIRRWIHDGDMLATRLPSGGLRISESDLQGFITAGRTKKDARVKEKSTSA